MSDSRYNLGEIAFREIGPVLYLNAGDPNRPRAVLTTANNGQEELPKTDHADITTAHDVGIMSDVFGADLEHVRSTSCSVEANWKLVFEEWSRLPNSDILEYAIDVQFPHSLVCTQRPRRPPPGGDPDDKDHEPSLNVSNFFQHASVYPNVIYHRSGPWLATHVIKPLGVSSTFVQTDWFLARTPALGEDGGGRAAAVAQRTERDRISVVEARQCGAHALNRDGNCGFGDGTTSTIPIRRTSYNMGPHRAQERARYHFHQQLFRDFTAGLIDERYLGRNSFIGERGLEERQKAEALFAARRAGAGGGGARPTGQEGVGGASGRRGVSLNFKKLGGHGEATREYQKVAMSSDGAANGSSGGGNVVYGGKKSGQKGWNKQEGKKQSSWNSNKSSSSRSWKKS